MKDRGLEESHFSRCQIIKQGRFKFAAERGSG